MRFEYSKHATLRMMQRNITETDLVSIVRNCPKPRRDDEGNPIYYGIVGGAAIQLVIRKGSQPPYVITIKVTR